MKRILFVTAVLFILISPVFGLRYLNLRKSIIKGSKEVKQFENDSYTKNLSSWAAINGYAAVFSFMIGVILILWSIKQRTELFDNTKEALGKN